MLLPLDFAGSDHIQWRLVPPPNDLTVLGGETVILRLGALHKVSLSKLLYLAQLILEASLTLFQFELLPFPILPSTISFHSLYIFIIYIFYRIKQIIDPPVVFRLYRVMF